STSHFIIRACASVRCSCSATPRCPPESGGSRSSGCRCQRSPRAPQTARAVRCSKVRTARRSCCSSPSAEGMRMSRRPLSAVLALLASPVALLLASPPAFSDAGMWTFHDFPRELVKGRYGADLSPAWLERVRTATARLSNCTASFVSPDGLMLTHHHCAEVCLDEHSSPEHNLLQSGFLARTRAEELKCGTQVADVLMGLEEVTAAVQAAIRGLDARSANDTRKKTLTQLEQTCEQQSRRGRYGPRQCEPVDPYQGGQYWLYKYRRYQDVRLVFAPERDIAAFGGD